MLNCKTKFLSYFVLYFNLIFVIGGPVLLIIAILKKNDIDAGLKKVNRLLNVAPTIAIPVGVLTFLKAFLGCWGSYKKKPHLLLMYTVLVLMLLLVQLTIAYMSINLLMNCDLIRYVINHDVEENFEWYGKNKNRAKDIDDIQQKFQCCGVKGATYWNITAATPNITNVPPSCCKGKSKPCTKPFEPGCVERIYKTVKSALIVVAASAMFFLITELIIVLSAMYLRFKLRKDAAAQPTQV